MQDLTSALERVVQWLLLPASVYGAGGALMSAARARRSPAQTLVEVVGGVITANMLCPLIEDMAPDQYHYTLFFLAGWGGLSLVGSLYEAAAETIANHIRRHMGKP